MLHHPVYSIKGKTNNLAVRWMFDGLFREYGVDLVLQGHEHNYARMTNKNDEGEMTTPLYLVSHASPKSYRLSFNDKYDRFDGPPFLPAYRRDGRHAPDASLSGE